jgi:putative transposase
MNQTFVPPFSVDRLDEEGFAEWSRDLGLRPQTLAAIGRIRSSPPARRVQNRAGNLISFYPSLKMGHTVQAESGTVELPAIYVYEHDPEVLEFWDQPPSFLLRYRTSTGKPVGVSHTPDFFVIRKQEAGWEEWNPEAKLAKLSREKPNRYVRLDDGRWRCPPGEEYAAAFGLFYRLRSSEELNPLLVRNLVFLGDYLRDVPPVPEEVATRVLALVAAFPGRSLAELRKRVSDGATSDQVFALIATGRLYADPSEALLIEPQRVRLFCDRESAAAFLVAPSPLSVPSMNPVSPIVVEVGACLEWDGLKVRIVHVGGTAITLQSEDDKPIEICHSDWDALLKKGAVRPVRSEIGTEEERRGASRMETAASHRIAQANVRQLVHANRRAMAIQPRLWEHSATGSTRMEHGMEGMVSGKGEEAVSPRTERYWRAKYRDADQVYGYGYIGLIDNSHLRGNRGDKLPVESRELLNTFIEEKYEKALNPSLSAVHRLLKTACEDQGIWAPSYKTFCAAVKSRKPHEQTYKRQGRRAAYQKKTFYWRLDQDTPRHGDRPFERCYIDHTPLDIKLRCSRTDKVLGRPWATFLMDGFTRRLLAIWITFDPPSYRSVMMVLRVCVLRHGRLPETVVVDNGKEFKSTYLDTLLACYEVIKAVRPAAQARFAAIIERLFGTAHTMFIYQLEGNMQNDKRGRDATKAVRAEAHAVWTLGSLYRRLCQFGYEVYDAREHPAVCISLREGFAAGVALGGERLHRRISYDETFQMLTLPSTRSGTALVHPQKGVRIHYFDYWSDAFHDPKLHGRSVPVRYDPWDVSVSLRVNGQSGLGAMPVRTLGSPSRAYREGTAICRRRAA